MKRLVDVFTIIIGLVGFLCATPFLIIGLIGRSILKATEEYISEMRGLFGLKN